MQLIEFTQKYGSEEQCLEHFRLSREQEGVCCGRCQSKNLSWLAKSKRWKCKDCNTSISYKKNTLFEGSKLPLIYWYFTIFLITYTKKSISAKEAQRQLNHKRYEPIWLMMHKIRTAMGLRDDQYKLEGDITIDDAFFTAYDYEECHKTESLEDLTAVQAAITTVLSKSTASNSSSTEPADSSNPKSFKTTEAPNPKENELLQPPTNQTTEDTKSKCGRGSDKTPVTVMVSKEDKKLKTKTIKVLKFAKMKISNSFEAIEANQKVDKHVDPDSSVTTDKDTKFANLKQVCKDHITYKSEEQNYPKFRVLNLQITNVKNMIKAIYHSISTKYLQKYLDEFCWKLNRRNIDNRFDKLVSWSISSEFNIARNLQS